MDDQKSYSAGAGTFLGLLPPFLAHEVGVLHPYLLSQEWRQKTQKCTSTGGKRRLVSQAFSPKNEICCSKELSSLSRPLRALSEHSQWSPPPAHASAPRSKPSSAPSMTSRRWTTAPPSLACASEVVLLPAPQQGVLAAHGTHCHHSCRPCRHPRPYPFAGSGGLSHRRRAPTYMPFLTLSHMLLSSSLVPYLPSPCYVTRRDTHTRRAS